MRTNHASYRIASYGSYSVGEVVVLFVSRSSVFFLFSVGSVGWVVFAQLGSPLP